MNLTYLADQVADSGTKMNVGDATIVALVGYAIVFVGIIFLMIVMCITGSVFKKRDEKAALKKNDANTEVKSASAAVNTTPAPGSAGHIKLNGIADKDAAMIMAITAEKLGTPLNELRFISIKEVE